MAQTFGLLAFVAMVAAWLIPNHYPPWTSFYNDACMGLALFFVVLSVARIRPIVVPRIAWAVAALALIPWLQWAIGLLKFSGDAWICTLYVLGFATAIAAGFMATRASPRTYGELMACSVLVAAILSASLAFMQSLEVWGLGIWIGEIATGMRASANLLQSNNFATLLAWGAVGLLMLREMGWLGRGTSALLLAVLLAACALSQSRTSLAYGPVFLLGMALARRHGVVFKTRLSTVAIATAVGWALIFATPSFMSHVELTALQTVSERGSGSLRWQVWPILADGLAQRPWTGYGWLQVGAAELASADKFAPTGELYLHAHNLFFEMVLWCGYPLGLLIVAVMIWWFVSRWMRVATVESAAAMIAVTILGAHGMLELPYQYAYFLLPAGLWVGLVEAQRVRAMGRGSAWNAALPAATFALFLAVCWDYPAVEEDFRLVRFETLHIGRLRAAQPAPDAPFLSSLTAFLRFSRMTPAPGMNEQQLTFMVDEAKRYPYAASLYRVAVSLALNGRPEEARQWFLKTRYIHGEALYKRLKQNLRDANLEAEGRQPALLTLQNSLP